VVLMYGAERSAAILNRTAPGGKTPARVAVCVATYRRPRGLRALLESLGKLAFSRNAVRLWVYVVDNDAEASARAAVHEARARLPFPVEYAVEPERNISLARNRGVARALEHAPDFVAFIDDDEVAHPDWLDELLEVQARFAADVVSGGVVPLLSAGAPGWARSGGFFAQRKPPSGTPVPVASTSNALVSARLLRAVPGPFDPSFGLAGGGDSLFFTRCAREGALLVAAPYAVVEETVPPARSRAAWVLRRAFRVGNGAVFIERALPAPRRNLSVRLLKGVTRLLGSTALLPPAALLGRTTALRALWGVCYGAGCMAGAVGYRYAEYARVVPEGPGVDDGPRALPASRATG
jgi:glycosyltransferase involved in cell wall biosynthesis